MNNKSSEHYARALFELAKEQGLVEDYQVAIKVVKKTLEDNSDFIKIISNEFIGESEREQIVMDVFDHLQLPYISNLFALLVKNKKTHEIFAICKVFNSLCNDYFGVNEGIVYSAFPLDEKEIKRISEAISTKTKERVDLRNIVDPSLIGGIKIVVNEKLFDGTVKTKIEEMKKSLLKGVAYEN